MTQRIGENRIKDSAITTAKIAAGAVITVDIADANVTDAKIVSVANTKITGLITSGQIATVANTQITGTTGTGSVVLNTGPTLSVLTLAAGTATAATGPLKLTSGTNLTTAEAGVIEYDGSNFYLTPDTTHGRNVILASQQYELSSAGSAFGPGGASFFGASSNASLSAASTYDIECFCYFLKTTAGTLTWSPQFSSAATVAHAILSYTPVTGFTTTNISGNMVNAQATQQTVTNMTFAATASHTSAVFHIAKFSINVRTNAACNFRLVVTQSAGTITPQAGSFYTVREVVNNAGAFS